MRMPDQHVGQLLELGARIGGAGRVRRRVEQHPLGLRRDRPLERLGRHLEARLERGRHAHRLAAGEHDHVGIAHPIGRRNDHLVAGIERRHERVVEHLLAAGADDDLARLVVEAVLALELAGDRGLELRRCRRPRCISPPCRPVIASIAARLMLSGVSKSGSPAPSPITSRPDALSARALSVTAMVADGLMRLRRRFRERMSCSATRAMDLRLPVPGASFLMTPAADGKPQSQAHTPHVIAPKHRHAVAASLKNIRKPGLELPAPLLDAGRDRPA